MKSVTLNGFGFDWDAAAIRFEAECASRGITTATQFATAYNGATDAQRLRFFARVLFGAAVFPGDDANRADPGIAANRVTIA